MVCCFCRVGVFLLLLVGCGASTDVPFSESVGRGENVLGKPRRTILFDDQNGCLFGADTDFNIIIYVEYEAPGLRYYFKDDNLHLADAHIADSETTVPLRRNTFVFVNDSLRSTITSIRKGKTAEVAAKIVGSCNNCDFRTELEKTLELQGKRKRTERAVDIKGSIRVRNL